MAVCIDAGVKHRTEEPRHYLLEADGRNFAVNSTDKDTVPIGGVRILSTRSRSRLEVFGNPVVVLNRPGNDFSKSATVSLR